MKSLANHCFWMSILIFAGASHSLAQAGYPARPIRFIVPQATGGSNDTLSRLMAHHLSERLGKQVVVDNRAGADGIIGTEIAARAAPDGHTWLMASGAYAMNAAVRKTPFDPATAFTWISKLGAGPSVLAVNPSLPVNSLKELLALGKTRPGYLNMASAGGFQHFVSVLFRSMTHLEITIILYKGGFPALLDVMSGQAHLILGSYVTSQTHVRSGKLRALASGSATRSALLPDLPTIAEAGLPGYDASNYWAVASPAGTPPAIINRLNGDIAAILKLPEIQKRFNAEGAETDHQPPAEIEAYMKSQMAKWARVAREVRMGSEK
jgi:tripartite-type tricarboxylate transporter receptor subunit TctC